MEKVLVEIKLLSDTIFGSGNAVPGDVDVDVLMDEYGFPYFKGKTFKGKLREEADNIVCWSGNNKLESALHKLFGKPKRDDVTLYDGKLCFGDFALSDGIKNVLKSKIENKSIGRQELIDSLTIERSFTQMEDGVAKDKSLRTARAVRKGLSFYGEVVSLGPLDKYGKAILAGAAGMLRYLGTMETRGFGQVEIDLFLDNKSVFQEWLDLFETI
jgi:CRISPR/Cas system CSM-associated protein Csm3 (group 7 of RAMP superfamily)